MRLDFDDAFELDDFRKINLRDSFDKAPTVEDVRLSTDVPIVIRYDYVDLDKTDYNFWQKFTHEDTKGYFNKMKIFSGKSINTLLSEGRSHHFHRSELRGKVLHAVRKILPKAITSNQIVYHFGLYDTDEWANRETDTRCSRVYFMLGSYGHIYILFFDPYHELNPIQKP